MDYTRDYVKGREKSPTHDKRSRSHRYRSISRSPPRRDRSPRSSRDRHKRRSRWHDDDGHESKAKDRDRDKRDWDRDDDNRYDRDGRYSSRSRQVEPGPIVMLRNLLPSATRDQVCEAIGKNNMLHIRDLRLLQGRDGDKSYAFVEFFTTDDAIKWVDRVKHGFEVSGSRVNVEYSHQRSYDLMDRKKKEKWSDWKCFKCATLNFSRRTICLTCDCSRSESDSLHDDKRVGIQDMVDEDDGKSAAPSNVLIFRGLDSASMEETIASSISVVTQMHIKDIRLIKDKITNTSRGFCFVETDTVEDAGSLLKILQEQEPFFVDGRRITVSYARQNTATPKPCSNAMAVAAIEQAQALNMKTGLFKKQKGDTIAQDDEEANKEIQELSADNANTASSLPSTYLYDETSGFYYDTVTGLYYDPNTQYHYNSTTGNYCYYDSVLQQYVPVNADGTPVTEESSIQQDSEKLQKDKKKKNVVLPVSKSAKKIAKDMERWAKSVNAQKSTQQSTFQSFEEDNSREYGQMNMLQALNEEVIETPEPPITLPTQAASPSRVSEPISDEAFIDLQQLLCLLCKRKFNSQDLLLKHQKLSELHKQNLEKYCVESQNQLEDISGAYRDRAKERRDKYGTDAIVPGWKKRYERELAKSGTELTDDTVGAQPQSKSELSEENVGNKMMKAMGWSEGQGLGKGNQGIVEPIKAEQRSRSAGLGAPGSSNVPYVGGDYRAAVRSVARARFQQMF